MLLHHVIPGGCTQEHKRLRFSNSARWCVFRGNCLGPCVCRVNSREHPATKDPHWMRMVRKSFGCPASGASFLLSTRLQCLPSFERARFAKARRKATSTCCSPGVQVRCPSILVPTVTTGVGRAARLQYCFWFCFLYACGLCGSSPSILISKMAPRSLHAETVCKLCCTCVPEVAMSRVAGGMRELVSIARGNRYLGGWISSAREVVVL